jgi:hypothetical protein
MKRKNAARTTLTLHNTDKRGGVLETVHVCHGERGHRFSPSHRKGLSVHGPVSMTGNRLIRYGYLSCVGRC